jgi:hypothetical protein
MNVIVPDQSDHLPVANRRHLLRLIGAGVVGAIAASTRSASPVAAADNAPVLQGVVNTGAQATTITSTANTALVVDGQDGFGIDADGWFGNARFVASGEAPVGQPAWAGTLWVDGQGNWWAATTSSDVNGQWRKLAGPSAAGSLHMLAAPVRVYDSRPGERPVSVGPKQPLVASAPRQIDVTQNASGVHPQSRAALVTVTVTATASPGFLTAWPSGPWPGTSTVNFTQGGQTIATTTVVGLSAATFLAEASTTADVIIDVVGYYI